MGYIIKPWPFYALNAIAAVVGAASLYLLWTSSVGPVKDHAAFAMGLQGGLGALLLAGIAAIIGLLTEIRDRR